MGEVKAMPVRGDAVKYVDRDVEHNALVKSSNDGVHPGTGTEGVHVTLFYVNDSGETLTIFGVPHVDANRAIGWHEPSPELKLAIADEFVDKIADDAETIAKLTADLELEKGERSKQAEQISTFMTNNGELETKLALVETQAKASENEVALLKQQIEDAQTGMNELNALNEKLAHENQHLKDQMGAVPESAPESSSSHEGEKQEAPELEAEKPAE